MHWLDFWLNLIWRDVFENIKFQQNDDIISQGPGDRLNKKDRLTGYGDSHVKDKTSYRPSYL